MELFQDGENSLGRPILKKQNKKRQNQSEHFLVLMGQRMLFTVVIVVIQLQENPISSLEVMQLVDQCKQLQFWIIVLFALLNHIL